ncbi:response regulator [Deltaproteobacteria bacterium OttesenSCG-928-K17]|nr:response regulator [Deltaproteobacteria bacterium OttesenSCG-928-K17]
MYRVLIADYDPLMREALSAMISKVDNFEAAHCVGDGARAVDICLGEKIDIVMMDIVLPTMSGLTAAGRILEARPNTIVVIISAYSDFGFAREAMKLNIREYLSKPVRFETIKTLLLNHKKEPTLAVHSQLAELMEIVKDRDLKRAYYELKPVAASIRTLAGHNPERLREILNQVGRSLIDSLDAFEPERTGLADLPPINPALMSTDQSVELWLFKALDYVLWQYGLQRYPFLEKVYLFIESRIQENIGLNDIVANCAVSQAHLSRIFRKQFKVSVIEYLHLKKMNLAKAYFTFTDHSASEVAFRLGYNESAYFSKVFKKYERGTVRQYKQQLGADRPESPDIDNFLPGGDDER